MTAIVFIHGSGQNASSWERVRAPLGSHDTIAIELPADRPDLTATDFTQIAVEQMKGAPDDCVVVAHSASGMYLPIIANARPVGALVYLAAYVPQPGKSMREVFTEHPEMFNPAWIASGPRWADPSNMRALADEFLFHDVPPADREWSYSTMRPMRIDAARLERCAKQSGVRSLVVVANQDRTITPDWQAGSARNLDTAVAISIGSGHCPQNSIPDQLAKVMELACDIETWRNAPIDYDAFKQLDDQQQLRMFNAITAANRAEIVKTQVTRWRDMNRSRLTDEQIAILDEAIAAIVPGVYDFPRDRVARERLDKINERFAALFSRDEIWRAAHRTAPHIAPPAKR